MGIGKDVIMVDDGNSKLWGRNIGVYPLHHFLYQRGSGQELTWPLRLFATGWDDWIEGCERNRANSDTFSLEFVQEGAFVFVQNGKRHVVRPGELFITHIGKDSFMRTEGAFARKRAMIGGGASLRGMLASLGLDKVDVLTPCDGERLNYLYDQAEDCFRKKDPGFARRASSAFYEALVLLGESLSAESVPEPLRKALAIFEGSVGSRPSLGELSKLCACSPATLQRLFKRRFGASPVEHLIKLRMEQAKEMLSISSLPVKEIARQLGYANQLYFSSEFKKRIGVSPSDYRLRPKREGRL